MRLLANNQIAAYEYLDGREIFTDQYRIKVRDILDRFYILYTEAKGSTEKNPKFNIDESDVPANEVLSYYIIEKWEFDTRNNRLRPRVEALCPVLHRSGDFGGEAVKYPMFWIKFSDIRPWLAQQTIFVNDDNNLPTCNYDDFFNLTMYDGEIYKTRNLKNRSMMQLYPDPDDRQRAQDSIQARLDNFEKKLWVPSREEVIAAREAREGKAVKADSTAAATVTEVAATETETKTPVRSTKRSTKKSSIKTKEPKVQKASSSSSATRSVRRRK
jgi:gliding motility associated protien GldN